MDVLSVYVIIVFGLIILFVVSFTLFIRRILINFSSKEKETSDIGTKLDLIVEQNKKILTLLEEKLK